MGGLVRSACTGGVMVKFDSYIYLYIIIIYNVKYYDYYKYNQ